MTVLVLLSTHHGDLPHGAWRESVLSLLGAIAALAIGYRRWPLGLLSVICALSLFDANVGPITLPILLAMFNVALRCGRREIAAAFAISLVGLLGGGVIHSTESWAFRSILLAVVAVGLATAAGLYFAARRAYIARLPNAPISSSASGCCSPTRRSPRSACGSRASSTTWWRTRSA